MCVFLSQLRSNSIAIAKSIELPVKQNKKTETHRRSTQTNTTTHPSLPFLYLHTLHPCFASPCPALHHHRKPSPHSAHHLITTPPKIQSHPSPISLPPFQSQLRTSHLAIPSTRFHPPAKTLHTPLANCTLPSCLRGRKACMYFVCNAYTYFRMRAGPTFESPLLDGEAEGGGRVFGFRILPYTYMPSPTYLPSYLLPASY